MMISFGDKIEVEDLLEVGFKFTCTQLVLTKCMMELYWQFRKHC